MSDQKFTKGPWHVKNLDVADSENHAIARCYYNWLFSDDDDEVMAQATFNASLIAAAPDMYALLLDIVTDYQCMPNPAVMADKIEAVLKKARGEE